MVQDVTQQPRFLLKVEEAARALSLSRMSVYRLIDAGELPSVKIGGSRRISVVALQTYIAQLEEKSHANSTTGQARGIDFSA